MNRLGMLVDLAHVSPRHDGADALTVRRHRSSSRIPVRAPLVDHRRNVPDSILARVPKNGGIVMVPFVTDFVSKAAFEHGQSLRPRSAPRSRRNFRMTVRPGARHERLGGVAPAPPVMLTDVADHIDHVRKSPGWTTWASAAISMASPIPSSVSRMCQVSDLFAELARRGWTEADLRKLAGENLLRVMTQAEAVAARLQRERPASTATIEELDHTPPHS